MRQTIRQASAGPTLTAQQKKIIDELPAKFALATKSEMSWNKLKPQFVQIYQETFDQTEIDGSTAFYRTPLGQALIDKTPAMTARVLELVQVTVQALRPKMQAAIAETMEEAKRAK